MSDGPVFRTGRKCPNHVFIQLGPEPDDTDVEVAVTHSNDMGRLVAAALNGMGPLGQRIIGLAAQEMGPRP